MATQSDEYVVSFRAEGADQLGDAFKKTADAGERFGDRINKSGSSLDGLRLKSDERIARNLGGIAQAFASGGSAADILAESVVRLGESFRGSLLFGGAAAVGLGLYQAVTRTGEAVIKFESNIADLRRPQGNADFLGLDQINKRLSDASATLKDINQQQANLKTFGGQLSGFGNFLVGGGTRPQVEARLAAGKQAATEAAAEAISFLAEKTQNLNDVERDRIHQGAQQAELDQAEIEHKERLGTLAAAAVASGNAGSQAAEEAVKAEDDRNEAVQKGIDLKYQQIDTTIALDEKLAQIGTLRSGRAISSERAVLEGLKAQVQSAKELLRYYEQIGDVDKIRTSAIAATKAQNQLREAIRSTGQALVLEQAAEDIKTPQQKYQDYWRNEALYEAARSRAYREDLPMPNAPRYGEAYRPFEGGFDERVSDLKSLESLDFSNLKGLSEYDFSGLAPLSGLSISIQ
jgi:hypothetical protein